MNIPAAHSAHCKPQRSQWGGDINRRMQLTTNLGEWAARMANAARRVLREAVAELVRLNRAGLAADELIGKSRSDRGRTVAIALAHRRGDINRCC